MADSSRPDLTGNELHERLTQVFVDYLARDTPYFGAGGAGDYGLDLGGRAPGRFRTGSDRDLAGGGEILLLPAGVPSRLLERGDLVGTPRGHGRAGPARITPSEDPYPPYRGRGRGIVRSQWATISSAEKPG